MAAPDQPARVRLEIDGRVATIVNDNPDKHNAFDDEMDAELFAILDEGDIVAQAVLLEGFLDQEAVIRIVFGDNDADRLGGSHGHAAFGLICFTGRATIKVVPWFGAL